MSVHTQNRQMNDTTTDWTTDKVRSTFIDYFTQKDHVLYPSSPCAPLNDPTLLFCNAGMNQFKPIFLGQAVSPLSNLERVVNSQKCIRAGGKHNDLEDVGRDTYHHTFFEMLGSWSFGDYFKKEAIEYAWELLTQVYGLDSERIYATYFQGDYQVEADVEARDYWLQYLPQERVIGCSAKDNFWEMGETGPCGPCSEAHYDRVGNRDASSLVNADDPNVIEIWNLVFIQFNRNDDGTLSPLPSKHVDTGMGLERLVSILQDKSSNYDIDVFQPLFSKIAEHSQVGEYEGKLLDDDVTIKDTAYRVIADHARTLAFAIADGAVPDNDGRGHVLRRILRRATRYGQQILKASPGFFATLMPVVVDTFGDAYPELVKNQDTIVEIVCEEEELFSKMLVRGIKFFGSLQSNLEKEGKNTITADKAFFLYDTHGFPIDLTVLMAEEAGLEVDVDGFEEEMKARKRRDHDNRKKTGRGARLELIAEHTAWLMDSGICQTDDSFKYDCDIELTGTVRALFSADGFYANDVAAQKGDCVGVILDKSSFYAEAGGQDADTGTIEILDESGDAVGSFDVTDVQSFGGYVLHSGIFQDGQVEIGSSVKCKVDYDRRRLVAPNHSMTHVLNAVLRNVLGDSVEQRGSLCNDEKLRFDFSHKKALTLRQLGAIEEQCQGIIAESLPVSSKIMPLQEAKAIGGVRTVFGEVYPDPVRVVTIGDDTSVEFCGGTHVNNTSEAEAFAIVEESSVATGTRRITAITKDAATQAIQRGVDIETNVKEAEQLPLDTPGLDKKAGAMRNELDESCIPVTVKAKLASRIEAIRKKGIEAKKAALANRLDCCLIDVKAQLKDALDQGKRALVLQVDIGADSKLSQKVVKTAQSVASEMAFMGLSEDDSKLLAFAIVPPCLVEIGFKADEWIRSTLGVCEGRGGGNSGRAQGQANECRNTHQVLAAASAFANSKVGVDES